MGNNSNIIKIWGERRRILLTDISEIDLLYLKRGYFCSTHHHKSKNNLFTVIQGKVKIETEFGNIILKKNESFEVNASLKHRFIALTKAIMIEIAFVTQGKIDENDIIRQTLGGKIINNKEYTINQLKENRMLKLNKEDKS